MSAPKKLFIKTYGCQMNVYDSERMAEALGGEGYVPTDRRCRPDPCAHRHAPWRRFAPTAPRTLT